MSKERKRSKKDTSWLRRFFSWLFSPSYEEYSPEDEAPSPAPPEKLPPKDAAYQPRGKLYQMLDSRPKMLAQGGGSAAKPLTVYNYCGVVFYKADTVYHYRNPGLDIHVGDRVQAPVHIHGGTEMAIGLVVSSGEYLAECVPYPVAETSLIVKKL